MEGPKHHQIQPDERLGTHRRNNFIVTERLPGCNLNRGFSDDGVNATVALEGVIIPAKRKMERSLDDVKKL